MSLTSIYKKYIFLGVLTLIVFFPSVFVSAASDMSDIWSQQSGKTASWSLPVDAPALGNFAEFLVYFLFAFLGVFAIISIFIGRIKMYLAGSAEDDYDKAKHTFITGIVTLVLVVGVYASLDYVFVLVEEWSSRMA